MKSDSISRQIQAELEDALRSRKAGNEGRARVCARRAAGLAARQHLEARSEKLPRRNVYRALVALKENGERLSPAAELAVDRLTRRVDQDHQLPPEIDLIQEARTLISCLLDPDQDPAEPEGGDA